MRRMPKPAPRVFVNLGPSQLFDRSIVSRLDRLLGAAGLIPDDVVVEITEGEVASRFDDFVEVVGEIRSRGIRIALDDFGAGYSFLSFLEDYPLDALKIDRSLARSIAVRDDAALLLRGIVEIGRNNDMSVIVEGVETIPQRDRARELGIELAQGFLYSKPHPLELLKL